MESAADTFNKFTSLILTKFHNFKVILQILKNPSDSSCIFWHIVIQYSNCGLNFFDKMLSTFQLLVQLHCSPLDQYSPLIMDCSFIYAPGKFFYRIIYQILLKIFFKNWDFWEAYWTVENIWWVEESRFSSFWNCVGAQALYLPVSWQQAALSICVFVYFQC